MSTRSFVSLTLVILLNTCVSAQAIGDDLSTSESEHVSRQLPLGELGRVIELGREIVENTKDHPLSKAYVGNSLNCTSCHLDAGTHPEAASFLGVAAAYPAWSPREQRVITLQDRALNCFMRSENGIRPPVGSEVAIAITAYITWLSTDQPIRMNPDKPLGPNHVRPLKDSVGDIDRGKPLYEDYCASCHGDDGLGSDDGPPVWGDKSYNDGAGLIRVPKLASWLKVAMPLDNASLSPQEALDIAAYINSHDRPKFNLQEHLPTDNQAGVFNGEAKE
ncbi:c-type cytochrome [Aporhodopirellula aestuarii]|uniref:C-type cytochrome n=1 Tax=Aporhodopirellula aestuarii TaxID=2950107 RepID=A0ABT0U5J6_9BACT|nr:c-type cytochrome [Aporhodopirellula aestuarii]MCM2371934.1 c-type cytochrome [Aporhodopirellula aestuarii]